MGEVDKLDSLTRIQKAKICSSLLHRIRLIQGQTNLNFSEPHFIKSKEYIRQTTDVINNISEGLTKGCSETSNRPRTVGDSMLRLDGDTAERKYKTKRSKREERNDRKQVKKKSTVQDIVHFYECGEKIEQKSSVKLSQIFNNNKEEYSPKETLKDIQGVRDVLMEASDINKIPKKKRRKKRKIEEVEVSISSSMTMNHGDMSVKHHEGDEKFKNRRKPRPIERKLTQCAGDESDVEDEITIKLDSNQNSDENGSPKRKLKIKRSKLKTFPKNNTKDITEIVSTTINRLNNVNESVKKIIEESMGSDKSNDDLDMTSNLTSLRNSLHDSSSQNWSTITMSKSMLVEQHEMAEKEAEKPEKQTKSEIVTEKASIKSVINTSPKIVPINEGNLSPDEIAVQTSTGLVDILAAKRKKKKHKVTEAKITEVHKVLEADAEKIKVTEIPSSLKKPNSKQKHKRKKEHVNFITTPELKSVFPADAAQIILPKKSTKVLQAPGRPSSRENPNINMSNVYPKRRVKSAKTYRNTCKKEIIQTKSADQIMTKRKMSVQDAIEKPLTAPCDGIRRKRPCSSRGSGRNLNKTKKDKSSSLDRKSRSKSRDLKEIYQKVCSNTTSTIANINQQMSTTLKESIAHLNDICSKVRTTLTDMEKDEENYKKLKNKQSFEMSSEGGSFYESKETLFPHEAMRRTLSERPLRQLTKHRRKIKTSESRPHAVLTEPHDETTIKHVINEIETVGDKITVERNAGDEVKQERGEPQKTRSRNKKKRPKVAKVVLTPLNQSKTRCNHSTSNLKKSLVNIPIWQRKPPSVIEEIQLTVKKQATKSQYRGFLREMKNSLQTHVMPYDFKENVDKQQEKVLDSLTKKRSAAVSRPTKTTISTSSYMTCPNCTSDGRCTCGVTVENTTNAHPTQQKMQWMRTRSDVGRKGIQAYDILDEITLKDLEPIQSEYPRRDHINCSESSKKIEETLLYKLLYHEDPIVLESLLKSSHQSRIDQRNITKLPDGERTVNDAYKLYEQFELNLDNKHPSINLSPNKGSLCLKTGSKDLTSKFNKHKALHTCPKEFNDDVVIPHDLKSLIKRPETPVKKPVKKKVCEIKMKTEEEFNSLRSKKRIEDKLKVVAKTSSIRCINKAVRKKYPKNNIPNQKYKMKEILTVMRFAVLKRKAKLSATEKLIKKEIARPADIPNKLTISEENKERILKMSKRDVVRILKPYIFFDLLKPQVLTVAPVYPKYNFQNKQTKSTALKRSSVSLKDHDEDCQTGRKLSKRYRVPMQSGDEKTTDTPEKKYETLSQRQLWKNKYKPTTAESLINKVLGRNAQRRKYETNQQEQQKTNKEGSRENLSPKELNKTSANARSKLEEIKNISANQPFLGQNLDDIIDTLEFKIVDVLSNPKNQHNNAFNELELEIKNILNTISDLKQINANKKNIIKDKFKSKSEVTYTDEADELKRLTSSSEINITDIINKISMEKGDLPTIEDGTKSMQITEDVKEKSEQNLERTFTSLGKDIERVIEGLDTIMAIDENKEIKKEMEKGIKKEIEKEQTIIENMKSQEVGDVPLEDCEKAISTFCEQVDQVIKEISTIDELANTTENEEYVDVPQKTSDEYITPFMKIVKSYRKNQATSQSFVDFLDKLTVISRDNVSVHIYPSIPVYRATVEHHAHVADVAKTYNQAIQYEKIPVGTEKTETQKLSNDVIPGQAIFEKEVLCTNHWMQTDSVNEEEFEEVKNQLIQTSSTREQFNDVDDYLESLSTMPMKRVITRHHLVETATKDSQITPDLLELASVTVGCQMEYIERLSKAQVTSSTLVENGITEGVEMSPKEDKSTSIADSLEKFTNTREQCCFGGMSDVILNEYPRNIYTDSCLYRCDQNSDIHLREKTNSYPITTVSQDASDIISLYDSRKSCSDANERDFLEVGFKPEESYDSMLARYASSANVYAETSLSENQFKSVRLDVKAPKITQMKEIDMDEKSVNRHKSILNSVYGFVFALVFLGINLNYSC